MKNMKNALGLELGVIAAAVSLFGTPVHAADFVWTSGNFVPGTTAPSPLVPPDTLSIDAGLKTFSGVSWENQASVTWNADDIRFVTSSVTNSGVWDAKSDNSFVYAGGSASSFFNNGTFRKSAGLGVTRASTTNIAFINAGVIDAQTGVIEFLGGSNEFNAGTQFTGAGVNRISNNSSFNGAFTSANLVLAAGTYQGGGSVATLNGTASWTGGTFSNAWQVASGATLTGKAGNDKNFSGVNFSNDGTLVWQTTDSLRFVTSTFTNSGLVDLQDDASLAYAGGSGSSFVNTGTFRKSAGVTSSIGNNINFINNGGVIDAQSGTIDFAGGSAAFNAGTQFIGAGVNKVSSNATFEGGFTSANLVLAGGTYVGAGSGATINGAVDWSGGAFNNVWRLAANQTLTGKSGADKTFSGVTFTNDGSVLWKTAENLRFITSSVINNGLVDLQDDASLVYAGGSGSNFTNAGTFRKSAGTLSSVGVNIHFINDGGLIDAQSGTIDFAGGSATFNDGTRFQGGGVNRISNNATFSGAFTSVNLVLAGGDYQGAGTGAVLKGSVDWTGGSFRNVWQVAAGQTLTAKAGIDKTFNGVTFTNDGTLTWNTTDNLRFATSTFINNNVVDLQADASLAFVGGSGSNFVNSATGTFRKSAGILSSIGGNIQFTNEGGLIDAQSGTIDFTGGSATFNAGTQFTGAGVNRISNNAVFNGAFTSVNLVLASGTYQGGGTGAILNGSVDWTGGSFNNLWQIAAGQTVTAKDGTDKNFNGADFTNHGTLLWKTVQDMRFVTSNVVNNGLLDLQEGASLVFAGGSGSNFVNNGTFRKSAGAPSSIGNNIHFINNGGVIHAQSGTIDFAGGSATFNAGTQFTGAGVNRISNSATFNGAFTSANLVLAGGNFQGAGPAAVLNGTVNWTGGAFVNAWQIAPAQTLIGTAGNDKTFSGVNFTNGGTVLWQTVNNMRFITSTVVNNGLVDLQDDASLVYAGGSASNFVNNGTLRKSGSAGTSSVSNNINFTNPGILDIRTGTFVLPNNFVNPGTIMGSGTVQTNVLTNSGHVAPGNSPGTLTVAGNYVQDAAGSLDLELANPNSHDQLLITGTASLSGQLTLACFGACSFAVGDVIVILHSSADLTGTFANGPVLTAGDAALHGFATGQFNVVYDNNLDQVRLQVTQTVTAVPEPQTWALLLAGLGFVGLVARHRRRIYHRSSGALGLQTKPRK